MVDLRAKPYYLSDADIAWVESTIAGMTAEEKVGQLFWQLTASQDEEYLKDLMETYHLGGCRYNNMPGQKVLNQNRILQKHAKVPVLIACNPEKGGDGICPDGTHVGIGIKVGATANAEYAKAMGRVSGAQIKATGCNMAFAPIVDIIYNWECEEVITRAFGGDPELVASMGKAYMDGLHETPGVACCAKHFPGNGQDYRDAHLSNNINNFGEEQWMQTYGKVYKTLIDGGMEAVMGGHIMLPEYMREIKPGITDAEMLPATLCPEIMTGLLRDKLGFNGMVVTDASHMVGMTNKMKRKDMLPAAINAGCDMFLFFNDPAEDFATMLNAYTTGIISEARMTEALTRILGLKASMALNKKPAEEICGTDEELAAALNNAEYKSYSSQVSKDSLTLVKYLDEGVLPLNPEKTKRIMVVPIKGADGPMAAIAGLFRAGGAAKKTPAEKLVDRLNAKGFEAFIYESPIERMKKQMERGEKVTANMYFAGKNAIADFTSKQDLVISLFDVKGGHPAFGVSKGGGEIPWYVFEQDVVGISVNLPTMLADAPMLRTYINAYDSNDDMEQPNVDIQWGNHDVLWMGAASGSRTLVATVLSNSIRYNNLDVIETGYGISLRPLSVFANEVYKDCDTHCFEIKLTNDDSYSEKDKLLSARMYKAITMILFKLEGAKVLRRTEFQMEDRALLHRIDFENKTITIDEKVYPLEDCDFPTVDPADPYALTEEESQVIDQLTESFRQSEKLQRHIRFLYSKGSIYKVHNGNLLIHSCVPMTEDGKLLSFSIGGRKRSGREFMDYADRTARKAYYDKRGTPEREFGMDFLWWLWAGRNSPIFGRERMATFERRFVLDEGAQAEPKNAYYSYYNDPAVCDMLLSEFGLKGPHCHIINGHVPVKAKKGESPIKGGGKLLVIDGGFSRAYQKTSGIAGYTLLFGSRYYRIVSHQPFAGRQEALNRNHDIDNESVIFETMEQRMKVDETDEGVELRDQVHDLLRLMDAYRSGAVTENHKN